MGEFAVIESSEKTKVKSTTSMETGSKEDGKHFGLPIRHMSTHLNTYDCCKEDGGLWMTCSWP